jgi:hypothetical protein
MGWHVCFHNKGLNVHCQQNLFGPTTFFALLSDEPGGSGGLAAWSPGHRHYTDPNKAARAAIRAAREYVDHLNTAVNQAERIALEARVTRVRARLFGYLASVL